MENEPPPNATRLTRERVIEVAVEIADSDGIESLTMRRLAEELGVGAMSAYYHVASKDELLAGMVDVVIGEMELPPDDKGWKPALKQATMSAHHVLLAHPWAAPLILNGPVASQARLRQMDAILGCFRRGGFSAELTDHAYHALDSHVMGFTLWLVGISAGIERLGNVRNAFDLFDPTELRYLAEHAEQHMRERDPGERGEFEFGLDLVLDGLERLREADSSPT